MAKWNFSCRDNGGRYQHFVVAANSKPEAINKAIQKARKQAAGDITTWNCSLRSA